MRALPWLLLAALLTAGCGGGARAATTKPEYETIATQALHSVAEPLAAIEGASAYDDLVERLREGEERARQAAERLREIEPPAGLDDENAALVAALDVLAEDFHRVAETLTRLREEGMPPEFPAMIEALGTVAFEGVELLKDALAALRHEEVEVGGGG